MNRFDDDFGDPFPLSGEGLAGELARLEPRAPSAGLRERVARDLAAAEIVRSRGRSALGPRWLAERLVWAAGGAVAATLLAGVAGPRLPVAASVVPARDAVAEKTPPPSARVPAPPATGDVDSAAPPLEPVAEESLAWSDDGVHVLEDGLAARIYRHWVLERYPVSAGGGNLVLPREDVFVVPVSLR